MARGKITIYETKNPQNSITIESLEMLRFLPKIGIVKICEYGKTVPRNITSSDEEQKIPIIVSKHYLRTGELWEEETINEPVKCIEKADKIRIDFDVIPTNPDVTGLIKVFISPLPDAEKYWDKEIEKRSFQEYFYYPMTVFKGDENHYSQIGGKSDIIFFREDYKNGIGKFFITIDFLREVKKDVYIDIFAYDFDNELAMPNNERFHRMKIHLTEVAVTTYHIYHNGRIEKHIISHPTKGFENKYRYVYHDENKNEHILGTFNFKKVIERLKGNALGTNKIELIDIREFKGYENNEIKLKFLTINSISKRFYINPDCYAGLLGAMAKMNIDYLGFNGFSDFEGKSVGGSTTHINGEKGDLRYLSKNRRGETTYLQHSYFDVEQQNKFNDALYLFGWGRKELMYSEYFTYNGDKNYLLNHTQHKKMVNVFEHYHHLHLTGFDHSLIIIIRE